jgi:hypothetical protein
MPTYEGEISRLPLTPSRAIATVARLAGLSPDDLEIFDTCGSDGDADEILRKIDAEPDAEVDFGLLVVVKDGADVEAGPLLEGPDADEWWVIPSEEYDRRSSVECVESYLREGGPERMIEEFGAEVCLRSAERIVGPGKLPEWLRDVMTRGHVDPEVVEYAVGRPVSFVRVLYMDDPGEGFRALVTRGECDGRRLSEAILDEVGGTEGLTGEKIVVSLEGYAVEVTT